MQHDFTEVEIQFLLLAKMQRSTVKGTDRYMMGEMANDYQSRDSDLR